MRYRCGAKCVCWNKPVCLKLAGNFNLLQLFVSLRSHSNIAPFTFRSVSSLCIKRKYFFFFFFALLFVHGFIYFCPIFLCVVENFKSMRFQSEPRGKANENSKIEKNKRRTQTNVRFRLIHIACMTLEQSQR